MSFRLADLLVLLAIVGTAILLGVGVIGRVHEGEARVRCTNNMRQIAVGCLNCNDALGSLPPYCAGPGRGLPTDSYFARTGNDGSVLYFLMPFIEANTIFSAGQSPTSDPPGWSVRRTYTLGPDPKDPTDLLAKFGTMTATNPPTSPFVGQISVKVFQCPRDPTLRADGVQPDAGWGASSYACNYLVFGNPEPGKNGAPPLDNPDGYDPNGYPPRAAPVVLPRYPHSFPHGESATLLFAEKYSVCQWFMTGATMQAQPGGNLWAWPGDNASYAPAFAMESPWNDGTRFQERPTAAQCNAAYASTGHRGGMVVATANGNVRTLSPTISNRTWLALCTPTDGEQPGPDF
jgi:hypothetical protein